VGQEGSGSNQALPRPSGEFSHQEAPSTSGNRKRKRNGGSGHQRKRCKTAPRHLNLDWSKKEGIQRSKEKQAEKNVVQTDIGIETLKPSLKMKASHTGCSLDSLKQKGMTVVAWDGVWVRFTNIVRQS
jgi:hypothetical protein